MAFDVDEFRAAFPEFLDESIYRDETLEYWASIAALRLNTTRWGSLLDHGTFLFVAHHVAVMAREIAAGEAGLAVGQAMTPKSNKSVGDVSVGYDNSVVVEEDAGSYNMTVYGREFIRLARLVGIGGAQLL